ncbi:MAG: HAMP domain-containing histidine kinase [Chloroflexi bacterium]|nr:HAMP domain-containing histidine kinase [Chloroflexota bacterium]
MLDIRKNTPDLILTVTPSETEIQLAQAEIDRLRQLNHSLLKRVGHELGSPLTLVLAYLRLWQEQGGIQALQELDLVLEQALALKSRLSDLVLLEQIETGRWRILPKAFPLTLLAERVLEKYNERLLAKRLSVQLALECNLPVLVDEELIFRVIEHLLSNAIKFSDAGTEILLATRGEGGLCRLTVADQGPGISQEQLALIFAPFYQLDVSLTRRYNDTGLGLKFVRAIVEGHGGQLQVESYPGKGSAFSIVLPLA